MKLTLTLLTVLLLTLLATPVTADQPAEAIAPWTRNFRVAPLTSTPGRHTGHSYYVANPESPDGKFVLFYASADPSGYVGDVVIVERATGEETVLAHNLRLMRALMSQSIKAWPFSGPVGIRERGRGGRTDIHVFDEWCYLGTAVSRSQLWDMLAPGGERMFDPDCYKILDRFLRAGKDLDVLDLTGNDRPGPDQLELEV